METPRELIDPATRRANLKLLIGMLLFAVALAALCIIWMHYHSERVYLDQMQGPSSLVLRARGRVA